MGRVVARPWRGAWARVANAAHGCRRQEALHTGRVRARDHIRVHGQQSRWRESVCSRVDVHVDGPWAGVRTGQEPSPRSSQTPCRGQQSARTSFAVAGAPATAMRLRSRCGSGYLESRPASRARRLRQCSAGIAPPRRRRQPCPPRHPAARDRARDRARGRRQRRGCPRAAHTYWGVGARASGGSREPCGRHGLAAPGPRWRAPRRAAAASAE